MWHFPLIPWFSGTQADVAANTFFAALGVFVCLFFGIAGSILINLTRGYSYEDINKARKEIKLFLSVAVFGSVLFAIFGVVLWLDLFALACIGFAVFLANELKRAILFAVFNKDT